MGDQITVRKALKSDAETLIQFNIAMARETEQKHLQRNKIEPGVKALFRHPEYGFYMIAEFNSRISGSLMITTEWSDWRNGLFWWIQSVYVIPELRRRGIYRSLYKSVRNLAENNSEVCGCRLYVEQDNITAQQTYSRLGMYETNYKIFEELF